MSQNWKGLMSLPPASDWSELSQRIVSNCKGALKLTSSCVRRRKREVLGEQLANTLPPKLCVLDKSFNLSEAQSVHL